MPFIQIDDVIVNFRMRRSHRAKRLQITVRLHQFEIVAPLRVRNYDVLNFVFEHKRWMKKQSIINVKQKPALTIWPRDFSPGEVIRFRDVPLALHVKLAPKASTVRQDNTLIVHLPGKTACADYQTKVKDQVFKWYQQEALQAIQKSLDDFCPTLGRWPSGVCLKQQKTRWGSCGISQKININWLLILAPEGVLEYVVAHELCHLFHRNHGKRFWAKVAQCYPPFEQHEAWLRQYGHGLLSF